MGSTTSLSKNPALVVWEQEIHLRDWGYFFDDLCSQKRERARSSEITHQSKCKIHDWKRGYYVTVKARLEEEMGQITSIVSF